MSLRSPFARRVRLALDRLGVPYQEEVVDVLHHPSEAFQKATPLGLIPALVLSDGLVLTDAANILEWLHQTTNRVFPSGAREWPMRQAVVYAEGLIQSTVAYFQETQMHPAPSEYWTQDHYQVMVDTMRTLSHISDDWFYASARDLTQLGWDLAVALEYMDLRVPSINWRTHYPQWTKLLEVAHQNKKFHETVPRA